MPACERDRLTLVHSVGTMRATTMCNVGGVGRGRGHSCIAVTHSLAHFALHSLTLSLHSRSLTSSLRTHSRTRSLRSHHSLARFALTHSLTFSFTRASSAAQTTQVGCGSRCCRASATAAAVPFLQPHVRRGCVADGAVERPPGCVQCQPERHPPQGRAYCPGAAQAAGGPPQPPIISFSFSVTFSSTSTTTSTDANTNNAAEQERPAATATAPSQGR